ncbi:hypothetical protein [Pseudobacillus wudalianchiensis]|uniref:Lipoprotein n=1 Tax=Pseudobacillus wudalianchiensis TaxID=1743143 RepID=A0A1B9AE54_9BACI|nr:hypothetical protein [Bacillus wudalianchiensis]OCA82126.1 hypothetical protein A8F95_15640 [Bacillus wudalianchiensis]
MNKKITLGFLASVLTLFLSGCINNSSKDEYKKLVAMEDKLKEEQKVMLKHINEKYDLNIVDTYMFKGHMSDDIFGFFYDKNDPSYALQVKLGTDGKIEDNAEDYFYTYKGRSEVHKLLEKHKPDNLLNDYVYGLFPDGIWGVAYTSTGARNYIGIAIMKDSINIDEELKSDYKLIKEIENVYEQKYPDVEFSGVKVSYIEKGEFDFDKFKRESFQGYLSETNAEKGTMINDLSDEDIYYLDLSGDDPVGRKSYYEDNTKPNVVFSYKMLYEDYWKINSFDGYKKAAYESNLKNNNH